MDFLFKHIKGNRFVLSEVDRSLSKREEDIGFAYIKQVLIPYASRAWNKACLRGKTAKECVITPEQLGRHLRKVSHDIHNPSDKTTTDVVRYEADFPVGKGRLLSSPFKFELYKEVMDGVLTVEVWLPGSGNPVIYTVKQEIDESIDLEKETGEITRKEEAFALSKIKELLVPKAVTVINIKAIGDSQGMKFSTNQLADEKDVISHLRKTTHSRKGGSDPRAKNSDYIEYTSARIGRRSIVFFIRKMWQHKLEMGNLEPVGMFLDIGYLPITGASRGGEGGGFSMSLKDRLTENIFPGDLTISKKEEARALQSILKSTEDSTLHKTLRKIEDFRPSVAKVSDKIWFKGLWKDGSMAEFEVFKKRDGSLAYFICDGEGHRQNVHPIILTEEDDEEGPDLSNKFIDNKEESRSLDYLKKVVIPIVVEKDNIDTIRINKKRGKNYQFALINVDDVRRTLKKERVWRWSTTMSSSSSDSILYSTQLPDPKFPKMRMNAYWFTISKNTEGRLIIVFGQNLGTWLVGEDPNYYGTYDGRGRITEEDEWMYDDPDQYQRETRLKTITKKEEARGLKYISDFLIPRAVFSWNHSRYPHQLGISITENDVKKRLRKVKHRSTPWDPNFQEGDRITYECEVDWTRPVPMINNKPSKIWFYLIKDPKEGFMFKASWYHTFMSTEFASSFPVGSDIEKDQSML